MTLQDTSERRTFKNTFAPRVENENLTVHDVILGLKTTMLHFEDLPQDVQDAVRKELKRQSATKRRQ